MAEFPALPIWTDVFIADAGHLDDGESGRYMNLLILTWRNPKCRLPNDMKWIARKLKRSDSEFTKLFIPLIKEFFNTTGNYIYQKRLSKEFRRCRAFRKKQSVRAKSRWDKEKVPCRGNASLAMLPNQTKPNQPGKNPPTPKASPVDNGDKSGRVLKNGGGRDSILLDEETLASAKRILPRSDIYAMEAEWRKSRKDTPNNPAAAFLGWCRKVAANNPSLKD